MDYKTIIFEEAEGIATVTLNRPDSMNALNFELGEELLDCLTRCSESASAKVVILTGKGRAFCAGGDVKAMRDTREEPPIFFKKLTTYVHAIVSSIRRMRQPVIAAVNGFASGAGFPLAVACDLVIASSEARFNLAYPAIGLSPDGGSTFLIPRLVGLQRASHLFFTGEFIDARKGYEVGFVNQVVEPNELMDTANSLARRLASGATVAIAMAKDLINRSASSDLETQMEHERQAIAYASGTEDFKEGIAAFFAKREARFKGR
jgi:2-(1,2-epoxy-1,2-dihydrophenyl)acetyl-CoA isomerase